MTRDPAIEVIELGNADLIGTGTWTGWDGPSERPPQSYPAPADLPVGMTDGEIRRAAIRDVAAFCGFAAGFFFLGAMGATVIGGVM